MMYIFKISGNAEKLWSFIDLFAGVLPREGIKGSELHPSLAELDGRVAVESADIRPYHGNAEHIEVQNPCKIKGFASTFF